MRILIISQYYPPENVMIPPSVATALASLGHEVRVLTGLPNYPEGRLYDGYHQRWRTREHHGPIEVLRVPLWVDHSRSAARRALGYLSFGLSASTALSYARDADVVYVYATQMTPALAPWLWRVIGGAPYVLHVQDLWPDSITGSSLMDGNRFASMVDQVLTPWLSSVYRNAAAIIGIAPTMVRTLVERGIDPARAHLVYNWGDEQPSITGPELPCPQEGTSILYGGNVGDMQDLETAVRAAHRSRDAGVRLTIVGDGVALPRVRAVAQELGATNITFQGPVPREQFGGYYAKADFALVSLRNLASFRGTIPSKFQAALSHATPVISTVQGDVQEFIEEFSVGFAAKAEDTDSLEAAFRRAAALDAGARAAMAQRAWCAYASRFSRVAGVAAIQDILQAASRSPAGESRHYPTKGDVHAAR